MLQVVFILRYFMEKWINTFGFELHLDDSYFFFYWSADFMYRLINFYNIFSLKMSYLQWICPIITTVSRRTLKIHFSLASVDIVDFKCLTLARSKVDVCGNSKFTTAIIRIYLTPNAIKKKKKHFRKSTPIE